MHKVLGVWNEPVNVIIIITNLFQNFWSTVNSEILVVVKLLKRRKQRQEVVWYGE